MQDNKRDTMKVYIITPTTFPFGLADTNRIIYYAKMLIECGIHIEVVIYKRNNDYGNYQPKGQIDGIPFRYVGGRVDRSHNKLISRYFDCTDRLSLAYYLLRVLQPGDCVLCYGSLYTSIIPRVVHLNKSKFVFNLCELPHVVENESWKSRFLREQFGRRVLAHSDGAITITEGLTVFAKQYLPQRAEILKVPILVDYFKCNMKDESESSTIPYIFHAGALSESKDGFLGMVEAFGIACKEIKSPFHFYSTGTIEKCPHREAFEKLTEQYDLKDKFFFTGYLTEEQLQSRLREARLVIINKYKSLQNQYCFSSKLAEYMAASKPIITTNVGEAMLWIKNNHDALIVEPEDVYELARAILKIHSDDDYRCMLGNNANQSCKEYFDYRNYKELLTNYLLTI